MPTDSRIPLALRDLTNIDWVHRAKGQRYEARMMPRDAETLKSKFHHPRNPLEPPIYFEIGDALTGSGRAIVTVSDVFAARALEIVKMRPHVR